MISPVLSPTLSTEAIAVGACLALLLVLAAIAGAAYILRDPRRRRNARLTAGRMRLSTHPPFLALEEPTRYDPAKHPPQAEWGQRRAHLARLGVRGEDIDHILGTRSDLQTRRASAEKMADYCRRLKRTDG